MRHDVKTSRFTVAASLALSLCAVTGAEAQEGVLMKNILGSMGFLDKDEPAIDYRERAPLVLPPNLGHMPAPQNPEAVATRHPAWPNDPDVAARKRAAAAARKPVPIRSDNDVTQGGLLSPAERRAGYRPDSGVREPEVRRGDNYDGGADFARSAEGRMNFRSAEKPAIAYGVEPKRGRLVEPPKGYRLPSNNAALGSGKGEAVERVDEANPYTFIKQQASQ